MAIGSMKQEVIIKKAKTDVKDVTKESFWLQILTINNFIHPLEDIQDKFEVQAPFPTRR